MTLPLPPSPFPEGDPTTDYNLYVVWIRYDDSFGPGLAGQTLAFSAMTRADAEQQWAGVENYYGSTNVTLLSYSGVRLAP